MDTIEIKFKQISGGKILDVGTGDGSFIHMITELLKDYTEIVGIDNSEKAVSAAKKAFKQDNIKFVQMDSEKIDFEDSSFDTVCISNTLHHLSNINQVLNEMLRVLKPGGFFIINEMFCDNQSAKQLSHVYIHHICGEIDTIMGNYHAKTYKKQEIIDIVKGVGIKIEDIFEYNTNEEQEAQVNKEEEKEVLDSCFKSMDKYVEKIRDFPQYEDMKSRINKLRERLYKVGFFGATELVIIGKNI